MGVDYNAVVGIGKEFYDKHEAIDFLEQHNILTDEDRKMIEGDGLSEWLYGSDGERYDPEFRKVKPVKKVVEITEWEAV